jgi:hypothetical protein
MSRLGIQRNLQHIVVLVPAGAKELQSQPTKERINHMNSKKKASREHCICDNAPYRSHYAYTKPLNKTCLFSLLSCW